MKVKFKITFTELSELVYVVGQLPYDQIAVTDIEYINLKCFYVWGCNKINNAILNNKRDFKQISIDVNWYAAIESVIIGFDELVSPFVLAIVLHIQSSVNSQLNRVVHRELKGL